MLSFFYDSLDTLKKVKKPTSKEVRSFTIVVFAVVIVASVFFIFFDTVRRNVYQMLFTSFSA
jgi:preprotein translocase SecE subunit